MNAVENRRIRAGNFRLTKHGCKKFVWFDLPRSEIRGYKHYCGIENLSARKIIVRGKRQ